MQGISAGNVHGIACHCIYFYPFKMPFSSVPSSSSSLSMPVNCVHADDEAMLLSSSNSVMTDCSSRADCCSSEECSNGLDTSFTSRVPLLGPLETFSDVGTASTSLGVCGSRRGTPSPSL